MEHGMTGSEKTARIFSHLRLTLWQLRQGRHLLLLTAVGMIASVILVCAIPLYSRIALSAGLRAIFTDNPDNTTITLRTPIIQVTSASAAQTQTLAYNQALTQGLAPLANDLLSHPLAPEVVTQTIAYPVQNNDAQVTLRGYDLRQASQHLRLLLGRLPQMDPQRRVIEIALPATIATSLHVGPGSELSIAVRAAQALPTAYTLPLRVVGLIEPRTTPDLFWQRSDFQFAGSDSDNPAAALAFDALASSDAFLDTMHAYLARQPAHGTNDIDSQATIPGGQLWLYDLNSSHLDIADLGQLAANLDNLQARLPITNSPLDILRSYQNQVQLIQVPSLMLLALITALLLTFINVVSHLLVASRYETIALLRSRGASSRQIVGIYLTQHGALALLALLCGPLLALPVASLLAGLTLSARDQQALNLLTDHPWRMLASLPGYALLTALAAVVSGALAIRRTARLDVLSLQHADGETMQTPFWQRFYLDIFLAMLAISGYTTALYEANSATLDDNTRSMIISPLILVTASCALVAGILLLIRAFPHLLRRVKRLAAHSRSALPTLALAQLAGISRQLLSGTLLLTLATAFALFTLLFVSTQTQQMAAITSYTAGADFSGPLDANTLSLTDGKTTRRPDLPGATALYRQLPGVLAASTGYITTLYTGNSPITLKAIDPTTFGQAAIWDGYNSDQALAQFMQQLKSNTTGAQQAVPAFVDAATWDQLKLTPGMRFTLRDSVGNMTPSTDIAFVALARVAYTPRTSHFGASSNNGGIGVLVDYTTFDSIYVKALQQVGHQAQLFPAPDYFWLRTSDDPVALAALRTRLKQMQGGLYAQFYDRRALLDILYHDPLYLNMRGILMLGAATPLALALVASLLGSRQSIRRRRHNLAILRALGTARRQLIGLLAWEQGPLYLLLLGAGIVGGWLLSSLVLPALVLASLLPRFSEAGATAGGDTVSQSIMPVLPLALPREAIIALAILVALCLAALALVIRKGTQSGERETKRQGK